MEPVGSDVLCAWGHPSRTKRSWGVLSASGHLVWMSTFELIGLVVLCVWVHVFWDQRSRSRGVWSASVHLLRISDLELIGLVVLCAWVPVSWGQRNMCCRSRGVWSAFEHRIWSPTTSSGGVCSESKGSVHLTWIFSLERIVSKLIVVTPAVLTAAVDRMQTLPAELGLALGTCRTSTLASYSFSAFRARA